MLRNATDANGLKKKKNRRKLNIKIFSTFAIAIIYLQVKIKGLGKPDQSFAALMRDLEVNNAARITYIFDTQISIF